MHLDTRSIELELEARLLHPREHALKAVRWLGEHGENGPEQLDREARQPGAARVERCAGHFGQVSRQHRGPPHFARLDSSGRCNGLDHQTFGSALAQLAPDEPREELLLGRAGARKELPELPGTFVRRARAPDLTQLVERSVDGPELDPCLGCRFGPRCLSERSPADAQPALRQRSTQIGDTRPELVRPELAQTLRESTDLLLARPGPAQSVGRLDNRAKTHASPLPSAASRARADRRAERRGSRTA